MNKVRSTASLMWRRKARLAWERFERGTKDALTPRARRGINQWAREVRKIASGTGVTTQEETAYSFELMPHLLEIGDAVDDPSVSEIVLWFGIREGKTLGFCMNLIGRTVTDDPKNICSVHPIEDDADRFSQGDVEPTIQACLEGYFVEAKSRDAGRTINFKKFRGGWLRIFSAGSATKFRGTSVGVMLLHELDALDPESIFKAMGRTTGFPDAIVVKESTGTLAAEIDPVTGAKVYRSRIEEAYDRGDKRKWFCACRQCGHLQTLKYEQIKYPGTEYHKAAYECEACGFAHDAKAWRKMAASGRWYPTAGLSASQEADILNNFRHARPLEPSVRSYWRNGFSSLLPTARGYRHKLHEFAAKGVAAQSSKEARMIWTQEIKAELWSPESEGEAPPAWKPLFERRKSYGLIVPQGGLFLTAFVDVQKYRLEVGWRAHGRNEESWGMDHVVIEGYVGDQSTWNELRRELVRKFDHESKAKMGIGFGFIDGGKWPDQVYAFFQELARNPVPGLSGKVRASKGFGQHGHPIVTRKMMTVGKTLKGHHIGTWEAKDRIYERLRMQPEESAVDGIREGWMHFNERFNEEYFQQLTVEQVTVTFEKGMEIRKYINPKAARNEALDIEVGHLAAVRLYPRNWDMLEMTLLDAAKETSKPQTAPEPQKPHSGQRRENAEVFSGRGWNL